MAIATRTIDAFYLGNDIPALAADDATQALVGAAFSPEGSTTSSRAVSTTQMTVKGNETYYGDLSISGEGVAGTDHYIQYNVNGSETGTQAAVVINEAEVTFNTTSGTFSGVSVVIVRGADGHTFMLPDYSETHQYNEDFGYTMLGREIQSFTITSVSAAQDTFQPLRGAWAAGVFASEVTELSIEVATDTTVDAYGNPVMTENGEAAEIVVKRTGSTDAALEVTLRSNDTTEATVPTTVTIPAGETSVTVAVTPVADQFVDGTRFPAIIATASGFFPAGIGIVVQDSGVVIDTPELTIKPALGTFVDQNGDLVTKENSGQTAMVVSRTGALTEALVVTLNSNDATEVTVPATVTIPAGQNSVLVPVTPVDDATVDGQQQPIITASAAGFAAVTQQVIVNDDDTSLTLRVTAAADTAVSGNGTPVVSEGDAPVNVVISRSGPTDADLVVTVGSDDASEATVPTTVTIPAGQDSVTVAVTPVDDTLVDGTRTAFITATASGYYNVVAPVIVLDNEGTVLPELTLTAAVNTPVDANGNPVVSEGDAPVDVVITRSGAIDRALVVAVFSNDPTEASATQTVTIPANQDSVTVPVTLVDDVLVDGVQTVAISAIAPGYKPAVVPVTVLDNDNVEVASAEEPAADVQAFETVVAEAPVVENVATEEQAVDVQVFETTVVDAPVVEEVVTEEPSVDVQVLETVVAEAPPVEDLAIEEPAVDVQVFETAVVDAPPVEDVTTEEPAVDTQVFETAVAESPVIENQGPNAVDDNITNQAANTPVVISPATLLGNDVDPEGDAFTGIAIGDAQNGTVAFDGTNVIFTPNAGYTGSASFTYTIEEAETGQQDTATVNLTIVSDNSAPVATDDNLEASGITPVVISPAVLFGNDYDPQGGLIQGIAIGNAVNGQVVWDGVNVIFTPNEGYVGDASFTYTIADQQGLTNSATVNLNIGAGVDVKGTNADDNLTGTDAFEVIAGYAGNDTIIGGNGDDLIDGGSGDDVLTGGRGNDVLTGGLGADTFVWTNDDIQSFGRAIDVVNAESNDNLDLSDLLIGEENVVADSVAEALDNYLDFSVNVAGDTVINVSAEGSFANGVDQVIVLNNIDITESGVLSDVQILNNLLANNHLTTDA